MRIIAKKTLVNFYEEYPKVKTQLEAWYAEMSNESFVTPNELKEKYKNASIINNKRIVFNIKGNDYRLIVDIEYKLQIIFIVWGGTHNEYDKIDVATISFEKND